jgi:hypothetical protein
MALSNAEKQARWRARQKDRELVIWLSGYLTAIAHLYPCLFSQEKQNGTHH